MSSKKPPRVQKDHYSRVSYLVQVAHFHMIQGNREMARMMARGADLVSKRAVLRLLPNLKRRICKRCKTLLVPGLTMRQEVENLLKGSSKADVLVHSCLSCGTVRRYPIGLNRDYKLYCENNCTS